MGLGILEPKASRVPGTVTIYEQEALKSGLAIDEDRTRYKYTTVKGEQVLLVPQPSDDPDDPLNWPLWKRDVILGILCLLSVIATSLSPLLAADSLSIALYFGTSFTKVALLTGYHLLGVGAAGIVFIPTARIWGKRHLYILGTIVLCFSSLWGGLSHHPGSYKSLLAARIFQGIGLAPFEALVGASVGDLYHVHQRGVRLALATVALFGSAFMTPVIVGVIANNMGWKWSFYFVAIFTGVMLPVVVLFVPETAYRRDPALNLDFSGTTLLEVGSGVESNEQLHHVTIETHEPKPVDEGHRPQSNVKGAGTSSRTAVERRSLSAITRENTLQNTRSHESSSNKLWHKLRLFNGRKTDEVFWKLLLRPFPLFLQLGILWACLTQGAMIGWTVFIGVTLAALLLGPPLFFTELQVGYMYSSAAIGAVVGLIISGLLSDRLAKLCTKLNKGTYEPEFRILLVIPQWIFGAIGLYGFGIAADDLYEYGWLIPEVFFGFVVAGMVCGAVASSLYLVDAHRELAIECFTCLIIFKNIFSFALTFKGYDWVINLKPKKTFIIIGSVQMGLCALSILMYVFGKYNRWSFTRLDILSFLKLR